MKILALITLLLTSPVLADVTENDEDDELLFLTLNNASEVEMALQHEAFLSRQASDYSSEALAKRHTPDYPVPFHGRPTGKLYIETGHSRTTQFFDNNADRRDLGADPAEPDRISNTVMHIGGAYNIAQVMDLNIRLGADLSFNSRTFTGVENDDSFQFGPQNATIFAELQKPHYTFRTGFFMDLPRGQAPEDNVGQSDGSHAMSIGIDGRYPTESFRFFGGAEYFMTLRGRIQDDVANRTIEYAPGDIVNFHAGGALRLGQNAEVGVTALLRFHREGQYDAIRGSDLYGREDQYRPSADITAGLPNEFDAGYVFGIAPHAAFAPADLPLQLFVKGAVQREYFDYGIALLGQNNIAPMGATFGLIYEL